MKTTNHTPVHENGKFWVSREIFGSGKFRPKSEGFIVWESGITHSIKRATIGYAGEIGLQKAKAECVKLSIATDNAS